MAGRPGACQSDSRTSCERLVNPIPEQKVDVVIPTLNAAAGLGATLAGLSGMAVTIADGGSTDGTAALAAAAGARVIAAPRGRGPQLAAGAAATSAPWLLFLHADTRLGPGWREAIAAHCAGETRAGYFRFALDDPSPAARQLERAVAWRCRVFALPYGDQGLLIRRDLYDQMGGFRPLPLMEDVDLIRRLGRHRITPLPVAAITSAARWRRDGWWRRSARNLLCLGLFFAGVPPRLIRRLYG